jgi:S-DNA-T family DNA segregation ATPase FtsK/SpoIIIE
VNSYRQMRRRARQARRAGMQPMMVINAGDPFPDLAAAVLARWAWRYRSELAPAAIAAGLDGAGWWAHAACPRAAVPVLAGSVAAAWLVTAFGARLGLTPLAERAYAGAVILASGAWLTLAAALGPFTRPLPLALCIGTLVLSVPWWAHRRRRARVRVERTLAAWPDIARAVGLAGSAVMSATADVWGWRARFRLARGQTITDVMAKIPAIESGLGTYRGAVRVYPTPDDKANRFELRVLDTDPHADAIPWPGPSVRSVTEPIELGPFEDAEPCRVIFLRRHALIGGIAGSGKSGGLNVLMGNLTGCADAVIWAIDLKGGIELGPWAACIGRLAVTPDQAIALLRDAVGILKGRAGFLASSGRRAWEPTPKMPALVIVIDEYAELSEEAPKSIHYIDEIARLGRALAVTLIAATQRPTQKVMGQGAVRSQMDVRICFRVREQRDVDLVLGQGALKSGWNAHKLNAPGKFLVSDPEHDIPRRARAYLVTDEVVAATAEQHSLIPRELDEISRNAMMNVKQSAPESRPNHKNACDTGETSGDILWRALRSAPEEGWEFGELMRITGMPKTTLYRRLRRHVANNRAYQVSHGRWRARADGYGHDGHGHNA